MALQQMELAFIAKLPDGQRRLISDGHPMILEIVVTEIKPGSEQGHFN
jgi:hypothetical protein